MARWAAGAKWAAGPAPDDQRDTPLVLSLSEGLGGTCDGSEAAQTHWLCALEVYSSVASDWNALSLQLRELLTCSFRQCGELTTYFDDPVCQDLVTQGACPSQ